MSCGEYFRLDIMREFVIKDINNVDGSFDLESHNKWEKYNADGMGYKGRIIKLHYYLVDSRETTGEKSELILSFKNSLVLGNFY